MLTMCVGVTIKDGYSYGDCSSRQLWGIKNVSAHCIPSPAHLLQYIYNCHNGYESTMLLCYHISIPIWPLCLNSDHQYILYGWPYFGLVIKPFNTIR